MHVKPDLFAIGRDVQVPAHPTSEHKEHVLAAWGANVGCSGEICMQVGFHVPRLGIDENVEYVIAASGMRFSDTLPHRENMEIAAKVERPLVREKVEPSEHCAENQQKQNEMTPPPSTPAFWLWDDCGHVD